MPANVLISGCLSRIKKRRSPEKSRHCGAQRGALFNSETQPHCGNLALIRDTAAISAEAVGFIKMLSLSLRTVDASGVGLRIIRFAIHNRLAIDTRQNY